MSLIFVGGGTEAFAAIKEASKIGLRTIIIDKDQNCPGKIIADQFILCSAYDTENILKNLRENYDENNPYSGVICVATDASVSVAMICEEFNLTGPSISSAILTTDKIKMKECFKSNDIPIPEYEILSSFEDLKAFLKEHQSIVIKPRDNRGARGVYKVDSSIEEKIIKKLYLQSKEFSSDKLLLAENYLEGDQISSESIILDEEAFTIGLSDRNYSRLDEFLPNFIEDGGDLPSLYKDRREEINELIEKVAKVVGIKNGVIKGDLVVNNGEIKIIEVASRLSGGCFSTHEIPLSTGINFVEKAIKIATKMEVKKCELKLTNEKYISQRYLFSKPGRITTLSIPKSNNFEGLEYLDIRCKEGDVITSIDSHASRLGMVICSGNSRSEAIKNANNAISKIDFKVK